MYPLRFFGSVVFERGGVLERVDATPRTHVMLYAEHICIGTWSHGAIVVPWMDLRQLHGWSPLPPTTGGPS